MLCSFGPDGGVYTDGSMYLVTKCVSVCVVSLLLCQNFVTLWLGQECHQKDQETRELCNRSKSDFLGFAEHSI